MYSQKENHRNSVAERYLTGIASENFNERSDQAIPKPKSGANSGGPNSQKFIYASPAIVSLRPAKSFAEGSKPKRFAVTYCIVWVCFQSLIKVGNGSKG